MGRSRIVWSLVAVLAVALALSGAADRAGEQHAAEAFKRALVTFAVARTLNGVISVAQGTEVAVEPAGVGVNFGVGQILDPINDLVERFSSVMLVASSSLGLQNILLDITGWWGTTALLAAVAALTVALLWWPDPRAGGPARFMLRALLLVLFLRFAVPVLIVGSNVVFDTFLEAEQREAVAALEATSAEIEAMNQTEPPLRPDDESWFDRLGSALDDSLSSLNVSERLQRFRDSVSNASEHIINLIVIFLLQTVALPLAFVWVMIQCLKALASRAARPD
ncbi:MAG: hypothetical protein AAFX58_15600 [Pseudomonadota bacterium]